MYNKKKGLPNRNPNAIEYNGFYKRRACFRWLYGKENVIMDEKISGISLKTMFKHDGYGCFCAKDTVNTSPDAEDFGQVARIQVFNAMCTVALKHGIYDC